MGIPDSVIGTNSDGQQALRILDNCMFKSVSVIVTGDVTEQEFVTHSNGNRIIVKGITIVGEGNTGEAKIFRSSNDQCILPVYFAVGARSSTSSALNIVLDIGEDLYITTTDRGSGNETFFGISYLEV